MKAVAVAYIIRDEGRYILCVETLDGTMAQAGPLDKLTRLMDRIREGWAPDAMMPYVSNRDLPDGVVTPLWEGEVELTGRRRGCPPFRPEHEALAGKW